MAETLTNVKIGIPNFLIEVSAYVTAKGAGTFTDAGITEGGSEIDWTEEATDIFGDRHLGALLQEPNKKACSLKIVAKEVTIDNLSIALGGVAGDKTGTTPNFVFEPGVDNAAQYKQLRLTHPGLGTTATRTILFWRTRRSGPIKLAVKKEKEQMYEITFAVLQEITGAAPSSFFKVTDT